MAMTAHHHRVPYCLAAALFLALSLASLAAGQPMGQFCGKSGNYTLNDAYQANIQRLADTLPKNTSSSTTLFSADTTGAVPNTVYALAFCRGDANASACVACVDTAFEDAQQLCAFNKDAAMFYDLCFLRFSNQDFLSSPVSDGRGNLLIGYNTQNVSAPFKVFDDAVAVLLNATADYAAANLSKRFGTGVEGFQSFDSQNPRIYGMVQCAPNMAPTDCRSCLSGILQSGPKYLSGKQGGRILSLWCNYRYEQYPFFTGSPLLQLPEPVAVNATPPTAGGGRGNNLSGGAVAGIVIACIVILIVGIWQVAIYYRRQKLRKAISVPCLEDSVQLGSALQAEGIKVDRSIQFSYKELCDATQNFSMEHKIGQGGFGSVYYAELRGEKAAIKKMDAKATQEFLTELKVLTHVHHLNLVRLIGYCVKGCLFLVYEFIENGNLSQHLHGTGYEPLSWTSRVRIALDSARGLEYIHEHTVPVYVHRDIKSANILIDKDFQAKVADFGLTKLTEIGTTPESFSTRLVGTFGYMPPEYARYAEVSPKVDVYAFGVVLYELISAKEAIVRSTEFTYATTLVCLFEETLSMPDPKEALLELIDPRLEGDDYPIESVLKIACLAKSCTHEEPRMRPTMRSVVVALMAL